MGKRKRFKFGGLCSKNKMMWKCIYCGREREDAPSIAKRRKYCSTSCQLKYEYGNADRGFNWKSIKKKIKERDNYTCQECGEIEGEQYLQVHHIIPYRIFEDNSEENLITLCSKCHAKQEYSFLKVKGLRLIPKKEVVYNFSVDEDESYVAEDVIVHNCRSTMIFIDKEEIEKEETESKEVFIKEQEKLEQEAKDKDIKLKLQEKEADILSRKDDLLKRLEKARDGRN